MSSRGGYQGRRLSIAGLSGIILLLGVGFAALRLATVVWTNIASTIVLTLLLTAVAGALFSRGPDRAYWVGFALFGWTYLLLVNGGWTAGQFGSDLTSSLDGFAERVLAPNSPLPPSDPVLAMESNAERSVKRGNFVQIGRLLLALVFALAGGRIALAFSLRTASQDHRAPAPTEPRRETLP